MVDATEGTGGGIQGMGIHDQYTDNHPHHDKINVNNNDNNGTSSGFIVGTVTSAVPMDTVGSDNMLQQLPQTQLPQMQQSPMPPPQQPQPQQSPPPQLQTQQPQQALPSQPSQEGLINGFVPIGSPLPLENTAGSDGATIASATTVVATAAASATTAATTATAALVAGMPVVPSITSLTTENATTTTIATTTTAAVSGGTSESKGDLIVTGSVASHAGSSGADGAGAVAGAVNSIITTTLPPSEPLLLCQPIGTSMVGATSGGASSGGTDRVDLDFAALVKSLERPMPSASYFHRLTCVECGIHVHLGCHCEVGGAGVIQSGDPSSCL